MNDVRTQPRTEPTVSRRTSVVTVWFLLMVVGVVVADARASAWSSRTAIEASVDGGQRIEYFVLDPAELVETLMMEPERRAVAEQRTVGKKRRKAA